MQYYGDGYDYSQTQPLEQQSGNFTDEAYQYGADPNAGASNEYGSGMQIPYEFVPNNTPFEGDGHQHLSSSKYYYEVNRYFCPVFTPRRHHVVSSLSNNLNGVTALAFDSACIYSSNRQISSSYGMRDIRGKSVGGNVAMLYAHEQDTVELYSSVAAHECISSQNGFISNNQHLLQDKGIHKILPLMNFVYSDNSEPQATRPFTVSISSSGVRAHARGGVHLCEYSQRVGNSKALSKVNDVNNEKIILAGCLHPHSGGTPTHVTISTMKRDINSFRVGSGDHKNIHLLDIYAGLRTITSMTLSHDHLSCMEPNLAHNAIISGTSNGFLEIIDGNLNPYASRGNNAICQRNIPVENIATFNDFVAVPDSRQYQVMLFDIRMLSRGYISTIPIPFMAQRLEYLSSGELLVVGNHEMKVLDPTTETAELSAQVLYPELQQNECITAMAIDSEDRVVIGTNQGSVILLEEYGRDYERSKRSFISRDGRLNTNHLCKPPYVKHSEKFMNGLNYNYIPPLSLNHSFYNPFSSHAVRFKPTISDNLNFKKSIVHSQRYLSQKLEEILTTNDNCPTNQLCEFDKSCTNFNQFLYSKKARFTYNVSADPRTRKSQSRDLKKSKAIHNIPSEYQAPLKRVGFRANSQYSQFNSTQGLWAGWDSDAKNLAAPVVFLLYFTPEIRDIVLKKGQSKSVSSLVFELFVVFSHIESITSCAAANISANSSDLELQHAVSIDNLFRLFQLMPDATALNLLDDSKSTHSTRVEMFYRFFIHHLEKEFNMKNNDSIIDQLLGITFNSTKSNTVTTRALTIELNYDNEDVATFSDLLRSALRKRTRLRAYNDASKTYETISQIKNIATNVADQCRILPNILNVSCGCQGLQDRLKYWWENESGFLPDILEVTVYESGNLSIKQHHSPSKSATDVTYNPEQNDKVVFEKVYELTSVISFIHVEALGINGNDESGHYVIHTCVPLSYEKDARFNQLKELRRCNGSVTNSSPQTNIDLTRAGMVRREIWSEKQEIVQRLYDELACSKLNENKNGKWFLFNGFAVQPNDLEEVTNFRGSFREPCIIQYRAQNRDEDMMMSSKYSCANDVHSVADAKIVAIDTEFVSVQLEKSTIDVNGGKRTLVEGRSALARMSIIDVISGEVIVDDYVRPQEPVVDYLTRFSGIRPGDLDPQRNPRVISTRTAYMKLRSLIDRGCVFVGHGLENDFQVMSLYVSPRQIIDTLRIYHRPNRRWISLRFLANFLLKRDMQQDVHDSVEDARAALELYEMALKLKSECRFDEVLHDIYIHGDEVDWKVA